MHYLSFILFMFLFQQNEFSAVVTTVEDGDSFTVVANDKTTHVIRLMGVDCPEDGQAFSAKAKLLVEALCKNKKVKIVKVTMDPHGRIVADVYLPDGRSVAKELLKAGYAWHYKQYSSDKEMAALEDEAKNAKKGLWIDEHATPPWDYRKSVQAKN